MLIVYIENTEFARQQYESALQFLAPSSPTWTPPVLTCSALKMIGIDTVWEIVLDHREKLTDTGELEKRRKNQAIDWMWSLVKGDLKEKFYRNADVKKMLPRITREVESGTTAPTVAASQLLFFLDKTSFV